MRQSDPRILVDEDRAGKAQQAEHQSDQPAGPAVQRVKQLHQKR